MTKIHQARCDYFEWLGRNARLPRLIESRIDGRPTELNFQFSPAEGRSCSHLHIWSNHPNSGRCDFTVGEAGFRKVCARFNQLARDEGSSWNDTTSYSSGKRENSRDRGPDRPERNAGVLADVVFHVARGLGRACGCLQRSHRSSSSGAVSIFAAALEMVRISQYVPASDIPATMSAETITELAVQNLRDAASNPRRAEIARPSSLFTH